VAEGIVQLSSLRGEKLTSVRFGEDFVEFEFGEQAIRALAGVEFHARGFQISSPDSGSRDAFCSLIGDSAAEIDLTSHAVFNLVFTSGARLSIPLQPSHRAGLETMQYSKYGRLVVAW
jgi:hypothetical protein